MPVKLSFGSFGKVGNPNLVILHGLLGSSRNWLTIGKELSEYFNVFLIDLRNHGNSPHAESMSYDDLVEDLDHWVSTKALDRFYLMGHSMGGKTAMAYACRHGEKLLGLVVEDIAPKVYTNRFEEIFKGMNGLDLKSVKQRTDADRMLEGWIKNREVRQFVMTNLMRSEAGDYYWQVNLPVLIREMPEILGQSLREGERYEGKVLFIRGELSDYIVDTDYDRIEHYFPVAKVVKVGRAGHNTHVENKDGVVRALREFLGS